MDILDFLNYDMENNHELIEIYLYFELDFQILHDHYESMVNLHLSEKSKDQEMEHQVQLP